MVVDTESMDGRETKSKMQIANSELRFGEVSAVGVH